MRPVAAMAMLLLLPLSGGAQSLATKPSPSDARLVVFITIDGMRPDYFERFKGQLTGGLQMLYTKGAVFTNAYQDHGITETAPGHASTMSGRFPVHTGIAANNAGVSDTTVGILERDTVGASPYRFIGTTLTDWLVAKNRSTRVLSVSRKDRGAILPIGRSKQQVYWYAASGIFTTSSYYAKELPAWVRAFNSLRIPQSYAGREWSTFLPPNEYSEPDDVPVENGGGYHVFPYRLPDEPDDVAAVLGATPWMDDVTLQFALSGLRAMNLGGGKQTDILAVSLSTTDGLSHRYGPDSREVHDQIVRLDRTLGTFFDSLFAIRKKNTVIIAFTADHGFTSFPEVHTHDPNGGATRVDLAPLVQTFRAHLVAHGVKTVGIAVEKGIVSIDRAGLRQAGVDPDSLVNEFRKATLQIPGVLRADRISELKTRDTTVDVVARRWLHTFDDDSEAALVITNKPYNYWALQGSGSIQAQHGTPHDADAHVPMIFFGASFNSAHYAEFARVVDMAPTLAAVLHVKPLEKLDGKPLTRAIH